MFERGATMYLSSSSHLLFFLLLFIAVPLSRCTCNKSDSWFQRVDNTVNFTCLGQVYYQSSLTVSNGLNITVCTNSVRKNLTNVLEFNKTKVTLDRNNEGLYICIVGGLDCTKKMPLIAIPPEVNGYTNDSFEWGQRAEIDCQYPTGSYPQGSTQSWVTPSGRRYIIGRRQNTHISWLQNNGANISILSFNPLFGGSYTCQVEIPSCSDVIYNTSRHIVTLKQNENLKSEFINKSQHQVLGPTTTTAYFSCSANVSRGDEFIAFKVFGVKENIKLDSCSADLSRTGLSCTKIFGNITVKVACSYSVPYRITCNFTLTTRQIADRNISEVAFYIMSESSDNEIANDSTGLVIRSTEDLAAPILSYHNDQTVSLNASFPFSLSPLSFSSAQDFPKFSITVKDPESNNHTNVSIDNLTVVDDTTIRLNISWTEPGSYQFSYTVSFFGEDAETSELSSTFNITHNSVNSSMVSSTTTLASVTVSPTVIPVSPSPISAKIVLIVAVSGSLLITILIVILAFLICFGYGLKYKKSRSLKMKHPSLRPHEEYGSNDIDTRGTYALTDIDDSPYHPKQNYLTNQSIYNPSINNSAMSLIMSEHQSHTCSCSCHTRSSHSHSSGPSHSSAASYHSHSRLTEELPRYGHPAAEYHPPTYRYHAPSTLDLKRQEGVIDAQRCQAPNFLDLTQPHDIPSVNVVLPTPVMVNETAVLSPTDTLLSPTDTEPFGSEPNTPAEAIDGQSNRPKNLKIMPKPEKDSTSTTPVSDNIMLAVMLFLQHQDCNDREHCACCKMITKQFEKVAKELGKDTLDRAIKDIQTPGTEGHKQLLRKKGRTPARSPHRGVGFQLGVGRNRASSTSHVHDNDLTFSSTETEDEDKTVRKTTRRYNNARKALTDDELERGEIDRDELFLPLSAVHKEVIHSEPDLTPTPVALPPSLANFQGVTPTNPAPLVPRTGNNDSLLFSDESGSTDDSSTSSRPNSNPRLDNINPSDSASTTMLLNPSSTDSLNYDTNTNSNRTNDRYTADSSYNGNSLMYRTDTDGSDSELIDSTSPARLLPARYNKKSPKQSSNKKPIQLPPSYSPSHLSPHHSTSRQSPSNHSNHSQNSPNSRHSPHSRHSHDHRSPSPHSHYSSSRHNSLPQTNHLSTFSTNHPAKRVPCTDNGSIHSSQSVRDWYNNSDQSSSGSTHSVHSESALYPPTTNGYHRHSHHHMLQSSSKYGSAIKLPQKDSTATPL